MVTVIGEKDDTPDEADATEAVPTEVPVSEAGTADLFEAGTAASLLAKLTEAP